MSSELAIVGKTNELYWRMKKAIVTCHSFDECKDIADRAAAMATYCKQINDDESVRKFVEIKLRAWRRISELCATIDDSGCRTQADHINKIRVAFPAMSYSQAYQARQIAQIPGDFFESESGRATSISGLLNAYRRVVEEQYQASPEGMAAAEAAAEAAKRREASDRAGRLAAQRARVEAEQESAELDDLKGLRDEAFSEVGITLDRRDRQQMKTIVFLISEAIHDVLRQAAFDQRVTMQAILRAGLAMWFIAHGYDVPGELKAAKPVPASVKRPRGRPPNPVEFRSSP